MIEKISSSELIPLNPSKKTKPKKKEYGCGTLIIIISLFLLVFNILYSSSKDQKQSPRKTQDSPKKDFFYQRISFWNKTGKNIPNRGFRLWIKGCGEFYPCMQDDWKFGGTIIEKAGPFNISEEHVLVFYTNYPNEKSRIDVPFKFNDGMLHNGTVKDMINIEIRPSHIVFAGLPIKTSSEATYERKFRY